METKKDSETPFASSPHAPPLEQLVNPPHEDKRSANLIMPSPFIHAANRRQTNFRTPTESLATVRYYEPTQGLIIEKEGRLSNLSENGAVVSLSETVRLPNRIELEMYLPSTLFPIAGVYEIKWIRPKTDDSTISCGLKKIDMSALCLTNLLIFLNRKRRSPGLYTIRKDSVTTTTLQPEPVRAQRFTLHDPVVSFRVGTKKFPIVNYSAFGLAVQSKDKFSAGERLRGTLCIDGIEMQSLEVVLVRASYNQSKHPIVGFEVVSQPIDVQRVRASLKAFHILNKVNQKIVFERMVPGPIRTDILEIKKVLSLLKTNFDSLGNSVPLTDRHSITQFEKGVSESVSHYIDKVITPLFNNLVSKISRLGKTTRSVVTDYAHGELQNHLFEAPFVFRSFVKPRGYAGDYEMMNLIYRNQPEGASLFAKCLHRYFIDHPAAKAVRNRVGYIVTHLNQLVAQKNAVKIMSMASGPAYELEAWFGSLPQDHPTKIEVHLFDHDIESLQHAQNKLSTVARTRRLNARVYCHHNHVRNVIRKGFPLQDADFAYSLGLFDYLADNVCVAVARRMHAALSSGGKLVLGNFGSYNPSQKMMEFVLSWNLIHRPPAAMKKLFSPLGGHLSIDKEAEGINLFAVVTK